MKFSVPQEMSTEATDKFTQSTFPKIKKLFRRK
jgi:hypothetical protein